MIFNRGYFRNSAVNESFVTQSLNEAKNFNARTQSTNKPTVFLSHKHDDLTDLRGLIGILISLGAKIYVDSMDNKMPSETCGDTAKRIKEVIKFCDKFVLLATDKAIESYWCNWELGIGDTYKYINHIALLPMKETGQYDWQYKGNEYLQIYPQIDYEDGTNFYRNGSRIPAGYYVAKPINSDGIIVTTPLLDWLNTR